VSIVHQHLASATPAPLDPEDLTLVLAPLGRARALPGHAYTAPSVFEWEVERFFEDSWVCVARSEELDRPRARTAVRVGNDGVLLVRDDEGAVRAFYNVCRHRGHELLEPGADGDHAVIRCPYHAWTYRLDGSLKVAPRFGGVPGFDPADHSLVPARAEEWHGWIFVNASGTATEFGDHVGNLGALLADHEPGRLRTAAVERYEAAANWKILVENYHECYHCPSIHPELCRVTPPSSGRNLEPEGMWVGGSMELKEHAETMSLSGESRGVPLPRLDAAKRRQVFYFGLFPNLLISPHPDYVMAHRIEPIAPGRSMIECRWLFPPEAIEREGFDPSYATSFWDITNRQDWRACESVQRGVASRGYRPGPLAMEEDEVHEFVSIVARGYLTGGLTGPSGARPSSSP
jgi:glycine betaine catabolism A